LKFGKSEKPLRPPTTQFPPKRITLIGCDLRGDIRLRAKSFLEEAIMSVNSFNSRSTLKVGKKEYEIYRLDALDKQGISTTHLPFSLRILLENLLRTEDGRNVTKEEVRALANWNSKSKPDKEIAFTPSRVSSRFHRRPLRS
jgi:hypothetical protein